MPDSQLKTPQNHAFDLLSMERKKDIILKNIKRIESELRLEELSEDEMLEKIATYKALSMKVGEQIQTISWKISQANFIHCCEVNKQSNYICKIERSNVMRKCEIPNPPAQEESPESLSARLETLRITNTEKRESISSIEKELDALKKRNDSLLQKLINEMEELENEERQLEDMLEQIQHDYAEDIY